MLRLDNLAKRYKTGDHALRGVSLEVDRGQIVGLIGPSGAGKSTLIRCINRLVEPTGGKVYLNDVELTSMSGADLRRVRRRIGMIFQEYALVERLTVMENVLSGRLGYVPFWRSFLRRYPQADVDKAFALLERVGLAEHADKRADELSGGQRQRVALARAIVNRPRVLLLDEPLGALDLKLREQMQVELKQIQSEVGITFIYVTHDQDEALTMSDRIAVFNEGRIEQLSSPRDLYEHPANEFVAGFVGVSNAIERDGKKLTIRPEKIRLIGEGDPTDGLVTERGEITESAYVGMVTRVKVELEQGGAVQVALQNTESEAEPGGRVGQKVVVGWRPEHAVSIQQGERTQSVQLEEENVS